MDTSTRRDMVRDVNDDMCRFVLTNYASSGSDYACSLDPDLFASAEGVPGLLLWLPVLLIYRSDEDAWNAGSPLICQVLLLCFWRFGRGRGRGLHSFWIWCAASCRRAGR